MLELPVVSKSQPFDPVCHPQRKQVKTIGINARAKHILNSYDL